MFDLIPLKLFVLNKFAQLRRQIVGRKTCALLVESDHGPLLVGVEDMMVGRKLASHGCYSPEELCRLLSLVGTDSEVLVVGGHVGTMVVPLSKASRALTVIEANPDSYRLLEMNLLLNGCGNVRALHLAASDKCEELPFLASSANSGGSKRMPIAKDYRYFYDRPKLLNVPAAPLDEVLPDSTFDLIVMDLEGSEYFALKGMPKLLARARTLAIEFLPHHLAKVAGITPKDFADPIYPFFDQLTVPSKNLTVEKDRFHSVLTDMFEGNEIDEGLIFRKL
jgi:FkbM family methyltransferase